MKLSTTEKLEVLSHAVDIAAGEDAIRVFYVDIGNVIDKVADEYIQKLKQMNVNNSRDRWIPRREGGHGTKVDLIPGVPRIQTVLEVAQRMVDFCESELPTKKKVVAIDSKSIIE